VRVAYSTRCGSSSSSTTVYFPSKYTFSRKRKCPFFFVVYPMDDEFFLRLFSEKRFGLSYVCW